MSRKIFGTIRNRSNGDTPVPGLKVQAWDDDWPEGDDFMGEDITDANGRYEIRYPDGIWDGSIFELTTSRPDIYISVDIRNSSGGWVRLGKSQVFRDHDLSVDLNIDLAVNIEPPIARKTTFVPSQHGFHFRNYFQLQPDLLGVDLGTWEMGFCGGMCAASWNRFVSNTAIPAHMQPPAEDTLLFEELLARQIKTTPPDLLARLYDWQSAPNVSSLWRKPSIAQRTKREWPLLKKELDNDRPAILVLIRANGYFDNPTKNHQVLAIGYEYDPTTKDLVIQEYDPNLPDKINTLSMNLGMPDGRLYLKDSSRSRTRGFLVNSVGLAASQ